MNSGKLKIDLTGNLYNADGTFRPLTANHGNMNGYLANFRNTYMEAERSYFEHILTIENIAERFLNLLDKDTDTLFDYALKIQEQIETGSLGTEEEKRAMEKMSPAAREKKYMQLLEWAEGIMCLCLAAAKDKVRVEELIKIENVEDEMPLVRGRR